LQLNERPLSGAPLPKHGCNVELTKVLLDGDQRQWWTLGFEAFGDLDCAPLNLHRTVEFFVARSFPLPDCGIPKLSFVALSAQTSNCTMLLIAATTS
jgi:hypothetical protein